MLEAIFQASFSNFLKEIEPGTWIPLGVFVLSDSHSHRWKMILDLIHGYSKPLENPTYSYEIEREIRGVEFLISLFW